MSSEISNDETPPTSVAIFGAGSIGCYIGGKILGAGNSVVFVGREKIKLELDTYGLTLSNWQGQRHFIEPERLNVTSDASAIQQSDIILVTVKGKDTASLIPLIKQYAKKDALVISLQNGIGNAQILKQANLSQTVLAGMVPFNVAHQADGHFHCGTQGNLTIEKSTRFDDQLTSLMSAAKLPLNLVEDMKSVMWGKLILNLNNSINALAGIPLLQQLQIRTYRQVLALCIAEALTVLKAAKIKPFRTGKAIPKLLPSILRLPNGLFAIVANAMLRIDAQARSSMWEDLNQHRTTEIDYINGEIISLGKKLNIPTPINQQIVDLVKRAEISQLGSPSIEANQLFQLVQNEAYIK